MARNPLSWIRCAGSFILALIAIVAPAAAQDCDYALYHGLEGYYVCPDSGSYGGYAWQLGDPAAANSGTFDLVCEAQDPPTCLSPSAGVAGDGRLDIESVWSNPGFEGCPVVAGFGNRIALVVAGGDATSGRTMAVSLSGANYDIYYLIEAAHTYDYEHDRAFPLACDSSATAHGPEPGVIELQFHAPVMHTDCEPGSLGDDLASAERRPTSRPSSWGRSTRRRSPAPTRSTCAPAPGFRPGRRPTPRAGSPSSSRRRLTRSTAASSA